MCATDKNAIHFAASNNKLLSFDLNCYTLSAGKMKVFSPPCTVIDTHAHIGHSDIPYSSSLQRDATPERLLALEKRAGVRYSVVVPVTYRDYRDGNAWIAAVSELYPDCLHAYARIQPSHRGSVSILEEAFNTLGLRGLKLALSPEEFHCKSLHDALGLCAEHELPVLVCSASCFEQYIDIVRRHPRTRFQFGHMGGGFNSRQARAYIELADEVDNVWLEPSFMAMAPYLEMAARKVPHRLMFGSDGPVNWPRVELEKFLQLDVDTATLERFLYKNAMEFLRLDHLPPLSNKIRVVGLRRLSGDLRNLGILPGDIVLVHSSLSSIGYVKTGANSVVMALLHAVSPGGTVLFPTNIFRGSLTDFIETVREVDLRKYPSKMGAITRAACRYADGIRSLHPTHPMVGIGPDARSILDKHAMAESPCDISSPYHEIARRKGKILLLGVDSRCNTTLHTVEEMAAPYIFQNRAPFCIQTTGMEGQTAAVKVKPYVTCLQRDFCKTEAPLLRRGMLKLGRVGNAVCRLIDSSGLLSFGLEELKKDSKYLLLRTSDEPSKP